MTLLPWRTLRGVIWFSASWTVGGLTYTTPRSWVSREYGIRQNTFTSPEIMVDLSESEERPYTRALRPLVDTFWQLDGRKETTFAPNGIWNPFQRYD